MATIKDVAREARVAISTVSAVLNRSKYVSPELGSRVLTAVQRLGYQPNALARSMVAQTSFIIGMAFPAYFQVMFEALQGIRKVLDPTPYHLLLLSKEYTADELLGLWQQRRVDGFLLFQKQWDVEECIRFQTAGMPFVLTTQYPGETRIPLVAINDLQAAGQAVAFLSRYGHRRIGFLGGPPLAAASTLRHQGFLTAMKQQGLDSDAAPVALGVTDDVEAESVVEGWLRRPTHQRPTAIITAFDFLALGCYRAVLSAGLQIPRDVSVLSFNHSPIASGLRPALTAIEQSMEEKGTRAVRMLLELIQDPMQPPRQIMLPTRLTIRESVGRPPEND